MKYAVMFNRNFRHLKEVDEMILPYNGTEDLVASVPEIATKEQRVIVSANDITNAIPGIQMLNRDGYNVCAKILLTDSQIDLVQDAGIPFFFEYYATTIEEVVIMAGLGATDVYVTEALGFNLKPLKTIKEKYGIQIRVFPNIAQCATGGRRTLNPMEMFWIRPEDTELYEEYVDVFELLGGEDNSRLSVVYEIYYGRQWLGDISDLILDFGDTHVNNKGMSPRFGQVRLTCNKACLEGRCHLCTEMAKLADMFGEVGLEVVKKKYKKPVPEEEKQAILDMVKKKEEDNET